MKNSKIIEIVSFKGNGRGNDSQLTEKAQDFGKVLSEKFEGFIDRKFGKKDNGVWFDMVEWDSMESIEKAKTHINHHPECLAYFELCDESSIEIQHIEIIH